MENERRYRRRNSDVKEENMESSEQEPRTVRHEYGSSSAGDSIGLLHTSGVSAVCAVQTLYLLACAGNHNRFGLEDIVGVAQEKLQTGFA